jgi:hypothetical protein
MFLTSLLGDNQTDSDVVKIVTINGKKTIFINGTLDNGTTAADPSASAASTVEKSHLWKYLVTIAVASCAFLLSPLKLCV